jgi:hypothetical protein
VATSASFILVADTPSNLLRIEQSRVPSRP